MSYHRVIPRDLFNESNYLKCLGRLALLIHDGLAPDGLELEFRSPDSGFRIEMDGGEGSLYCSNLQLKVAGRRFDIYRPLNDRDPWPIMLPLAAADGDDVVIFDDDGNFTPEFLEWAKDPPKNED